MLPDSDLWERIEEFKLDLPGVPVPFSAKLAAKTGWHPTYVQLAIQEYRKFVYLACVAGHPVSPSKDVDEVWHLHLQYTRSYWEEFCPKVLRMTLHHEPSTGGEQENSKFTDWYTKTLESYERIFEEPAPEWIWPKGNIRGANRANEERSNVGMRWISMVKSLAASNAAKLRSWLWAFMLMTLGLGGCANNGAAPFPFDEKGPDFLGYFWLFSVASWIGAAVWQRSQLYPVDDGGDLPGASPYMWARLATKDTRVLKTALAAMHQRRNIIVEADGKIYQVPQVPPPTDPFERAVWNWVGNSGIRLAQLWALCQSEVRQMDRELENRGLILDSDSLWVRNVGFLLVGTMCFWGGAAKVAIGLGRGKPVELLIISMFLVLAAAWIGYSAMSPRRSIRGEAYLDRMFRKVDSEAQNMVGGAAALFAMAIMGDVMLPPDLRTAWKNTSSGSGCGNGGSGCGGGDSGGGDGGGCGGGGCGGCGGGGGD